MKKILVNLSLEDSEIATLDKMAGKALNRQAVARMLLIAAIEAVQKNGGRVHLPPQFNVLDESSFVASTFGINDPKPEK